MASATATHGKLVKAATGGAYFYKGTRYGWISSVKCLFLKNHADFLIPSPLLRACEGLGVDAEEHVVFQSFSSAQGNGHAREVLMFMEGECEVTSKPGARAVLPLTHNLSNLSRISA